MSDSMHWQRWARHVGRVVLFEARKMRSGRRWLAGVVAAGAPLVIMMIPLLLGVRPDGPEGVGDVSLLFAGIFQSYFLRLAIFFTAVDLFTRLYRGEVMEKTLHYYLLSPVRREVILIGKYLAGLMQMLIIFVPATIAAHIMLFMIAGPRVVEAHFLNGQGMAHTIAYAGVAALASIGYGAVFMLLGLVAKNPIIPAILVMGWESINVFLPAVFQKVSIIHYLQSICPVPIPFGPLAVITEPTSPWVSVPGMALMTLIVLSGAAWRMCRAEVSYTND